MVFRPTNFAAEDRYLIKTFRDSKGSAATCLCKMFSEKKWNVSGLKTLMKKNDNTGTIKPLPGCARPQRTNMHFSWFSVLSTLAKRLVGEQPL